jgi:hypothetical protein
MKKEDMENCPFQVSICGVDGFAKRQGVLKVISDFGIRDSEVFDNSDYFSVSVPPQSLKEFTDKLENVPGICFKQDFPHVFGERGRGEMLKFQKRGANWGGLVRWPDGLEHVALGRLHRDPSKNTYTAGKPRKRGEKKKDKGPRSRWELMGKGS